MARAMKDSGIEWIGEIPEGWKVSPVKNYIKWKSEKGYPEAQVLSLYRDFGIVPKDSRDDNHNVTSLDTSGYKYVEVGDLVINKMKAWQGSIAVSNYSGIVSPAYHVCQIVGDGIYKQYLHYLLRNPAYLPEYMRLSTGMRVGQWDLGFDDFKNIPIVLPDMLEQKRIVSFLDAECARIDAVIEQTRASIEEYRKLKQSVITQAVTKGIRPGRKMKDSGVDWIGEIPEEWDVISIGRLFIFVGGYAFSSEKFCEETNHQVARMGNIKDDCLLLTEKPVFIDDDYARKTQAFLVKAEDILFTMTGTKGKKDYFYTVLVDDTDIRSVKLYINQRVGCFRKNEDCDMRYYNYLLKVPELKNYIFLFETGTANQGNLGIATIRKTRLLFPPLKEQSEIADNLTGQCNMINSTIRKKEALIDELATYKKSLIFEYVTGKKEVAL